MASLVHDIRQLFAYSVLRRFGRLAEADVRFSFDHGDVYLSAFFESMRRLDSVGVEESDSQLLLYAQVFERYVTDPVVMVSRKTAALISAALYWAAGYSANALVIARTIRSSDEPLTSAEGLLLRLLARDLWREGAGDNPVSRDLFQYVRSGDASLLARSLEAIDMMKSDTVEMGDPDEYVALHLLHAVLRRLEHISFWSAVREHSSAPSWAWQRYIGMQLERGGATLDLWPSQRAAVAKGLLDGKSSLVIQMPTSSGKTKMTEFTFVNDLFSDDGRRCLYLAPFRALVSEVERSIGRTLSQLGFTVASLYGGSEANEIEVFLSTVARVVIATPEKIAAVLKASGGGLEQFGTVVLDEGHLLGSASRGAAYELQLAALRPQLAQLNRAILLSAVLPNSDEIAAWLGGTSQALVQESWQPTATRIGVITWPENRPARLTYHVQSGESLSEGFFVPRLLEEDEWSERHPGTGRMRKHVFPKRRDNGAIAASLAFRFVTSGPVIVFAARPDWANSIARKILGRLSLDRPIETNLVDETNRGELADLSQYLRATLGDQSLLAESVANGFAIHHGGIPQSIRLLIEEEYRRHTIRLLIATNTIAQGVNFPAKTVIVHSFPVTDAPNRDFWNLVGRAGRAMLETEGEVVILATGSLSSDTLSYFLDRSKGERAESRILWFVRQILDRYPQVSDETIDALLADGENTTKYLPVIRSVDSCLLSGRPWFEFTFGDYPCLCSGEGIIDGGRQGRN